MTEHSILSRLPLALAAAAPLFQKQPGLLVTPQGQQQVAAPQSLSQAATNLFVLQSQFEEAKEKRDEKRRAQVAQARLAETLRSVSPIASQFIQAGRPLPSSLASSLFGTPDVVPGSPEDLRRLRARETVKGKVRQEFAPPTMGRIKGQLAQELLEGKITPERLRIFSSLMPSTEVTTTPEGGFRFRSGVGLSKAEGRRNDLLNQKLDVADLARRAFRLDQQLAEGGADIAGITGRMARFASSFGMQAEAAARQFTNIDLSGMRDRIVSRFGGLAQKSAAFVSNTISTAFIIARAQNRSGRLTDKDFDRALATIQAGSGDPNQIRAALREFTTLQLDTLEDRFQLELEESSGIKEFIQRRGIGLPPIGEKALSPAEQQELDALIEEDRRRLLQGR